MRAFRSPRWLKDVRFSDSVLPACSTCPTRTINYNTLFSLKLLSVVCKTATVASTGRRLSSANGVATTCGGGVTGMVGRRVHHVVLGEVISAVVTTEPRGRADAAIFELKDLSE